MAAKKMDLIPAAARATRSTYNPKDKMDRCVGEDGDQGTAGSRIRTVSLFERETKGKKK